MVMTITHISYITCLVTNDAWHAHDVIGVYSILHGAGRVSYFTEPALLWLAGTVMGEVGAHNRVGVPTGQEAMTIGQKKILY